LEKFSNFRLCVVNYRHFLNPINRNFKKMHSFVDATPSHQGSPDNAEGSLIVHVNDIFIHDSKTYVVHDIVGQGSFAEVYKVAELGGSVYAFKITKAGYEESARKEILVLTQLQQFSESNVLNHIGTMIDNFEHMGHIITIFNLYPMSVFNLLQRRGFLGFHLPLIQQIAQSLVVVLCQMHRFEIIHCDIKPENIVIDSNSNVRLIDFGGALLRSDSIHEYIQSRYYRAPEIILGLQYDAKIDVWSLACTLVELFIGDPIFAGRDEHNMLQLIEDRIGPFPPSMISLVQGPATSYFTEDNRVVNRDPRGDIFDYAQIIRADLPRIIRRVSYIPPHADESEKEESDAKKEIFIDFIMAMLKIDPVERPTIEQVRNHPFLMVQFS
jgi:dual specificity protein kinase YAK1